MLISQRSTSPSPTTSEFILDAIRFRLASSRASVSCDEYEQIIDLGPTGGKHKTGKQTIIVEIDGGDPDVKIAYDHKCCGE